jgi:hypothetical protein
LRNEKNNEKPQPGKGTLVGRGEKKNEISAGSEGREGEVWEPSNKTMFSPPPLKKNHFS